MWPFSWFKARKERKAVARRLKAIRENEHQCDCCSNLPPTVTRIPMPPTKLPRREMVRSTGRTVDGGDDGVIDLIDVYIATEIAAPVIQSLVEGASECISDVAESISDGVSEAISSVFDD